MAQVETHSEIMIKLEPQDSQDTDSLESNDPFLVKGTYQDDVTIKSEPADEIEAFNANDELCNQHVKIESEEILVEPTQPSDQFGKTMSHGNEDCWEKSLLLEHEQLSQNSHFGAQNALPDVSCQPTPHIKTNSSKPFKNCKHMCIVCYESFSAKKELNKHLKTHTGERHICNFCYKSFTTATSLRTHKMVHTGEKPFTCHECAASFSKSTDLTRHLRKHTGEKPYKCEDCPKSFGRLDTLKDHQKTHTGERPYTCEVCSKSFALLDTLKQHSSVHTGEKRYGCPECGRAFVKSSDLKQHRRRHTGEKPYVCVLCEKRFAQLSNFKQHSRQHTGVRPFVCTVCGKAYFQQGNLNQHMASHTPVEIAQACATIKDTLSNRSNGTPQLSLDCTQKEVTLLSGSNGIPQSLSENCLELDDESTNKPPQDGTQLLQVTLPIENEIAHASQDCSQLEVTLSSKMNVTLKSPQDVSPSGDTLPDKSNETSQETQACSQVEDKIIIERPNEIVHSSSTNADVIPTNLTPVSSS